MNGIWLFILKCILSLSISALVIHITLRHLKELLLRLCPNDAAAAFWQDYTKLTLSLAPLILVIIMDGLFQRLGAMDNLRVGLLAILGGLLFGLLSLKSHIDRFILPSPPCISVQSQDHTDGTRSREQP